MIFEIRSNQSDLHDGQMRKMRPRWFEHVKSALVRRCYRLAIKGLLGINRRSPKKYRGELVIQLTEEMTLDLWLWRLCIRTSPMKLH
ncbi:hypothetical protein H5410_035763 [Solanum commersonii]|uniref:Uncharacterized protein n=1 Tax=Solanum commersonii TaxID=4109 RepID=A0A9J5Y1M2_SOLCO|nr:hypothetical protein H5410_035763 [Solanum commersonii]